MSLTYEATIREYGCKIVSQSLIDRNTLYRPSAAKNLAVAESGKEPILLPSCLFPYGTPHSCSVTPGYIPYPMP